MKKLITLLIPVFIFTLGYSQIGINITNPDSSVVLHISSNDMGILIPNLETSTRLTYGTDNPADGVIVYDSQMQKFFMWERNPSLTDGKWMMINPWTLQKDTLGIGGAMILPDSIAQTITIEGDLLLNGDVTVDGKLGFSGIIDPTVPGFRIVVKNGIIVAVGTTVGTIEAATTSPYSVNTSGTVVYVQGTANPNWTIEKDPGYGNPNAFNVSPDTGLEGEIPITYTVVPNEFGKVKFLLKEGSNILDSIIMTATVPSGTLTIDHTGPLIGGASGEVYFIKGTGVPEWTIEIDDTYGNPDAVVVNPVTGPEGSTSLNFIADGPSGATRFFLKGGNRSLDVLIVMSGM